MEVDMMKEAEIAIDIFNASKGVNFTLDTTLREYLPVFMNQDVNTEALVAAIQKHGFSGANAADIKTFADDQRKSLKKLFNNFRRLACLKYQIISGFLWAVEGPKKAETSKMRFEDLKPEK